MAPHASWKAALLITPLAASALPAVRLDAVTPAPPAACIESWPEVQARARVYDHFVHLTSRCTTPARCEVSSDSNPAAVRVVVAPEQQLRVLVARGSPAARFVPHVACRFRPAAHPEDVTARGRTLRAALAR